LFCLAIASAKVSAWNATSEPSLACKILLNMAAPLVIRRFS
jgi:hypothetical protein